MAKPLQTSQSTIENEILAGELFGKDLNKKDHDIDAKTRWLVFKVKQKAKQIVNKNMKQIVNLMVIRTWEQTLMKN